MSELTDLQICKRIAEIEFDDLIDCYEHEFDGICIDKPMCGMVFREADNPLTDDALLNQLIFKYEISISFNFCLISMITNKQYEINFTDIPSLKRKCLLLIIEAHKDQS